MPPAEQRQLVARFWVAMQANDWPLAASYLHDDYLLEYPQSGERFRGREAFVAINADYPAAGRWRFTVERLIADENGVVSDVGVTDGAVIARVIAFFTLRDGAISHQTEYWPDPFDAPASRAHLTAR